MQRLQGEAQGGDRGEVECTPHPKGAAASWLQRGVPMGVCGLLLPFYKQRWKSGVM